MTYVPHTESERREMLAAIGKGRLEDLFDDPHLKAVNMFSEVDHPTEGRLKVARFPVKFSKTPASIRRLAPNLGEHTDEVLPERAKKKSRPKAKAQG